MRLIDADALLEELKKLEASGGSNMYRKSLNDALHYFFPKIIGEIPTITPPPNAPLTLDELREMDGEPVWVVTGSAINAGRGCWDICDWWDKNTVMFPYSGEQPRVDDYGITWLAYRRKEESK